MHFLLIYFKACAFYSLILLMLLIKTQAKTSQHEQVEWHICAEDSSSLIYGSKKWSLNEASYCWRVDKRPL